MILSDFNYELPVELIAQHPLKRGSERLMVVCRDSGEVIHDYFDSIGNYLKKGDCLVMNDSRVIPARLAGKKTSGGKAEVFLLKKIFDDVWECLIKSSKKAASGSVILFDSGLEATVLEKTEDTYIVRFNHPELVAASGKMPLPPYITRMAREQDRYDYQTVYAKHEGSVAAPTAGLHFTTEKLSELSGNGVEQVCITLHVGLGTFQPVRVSNIEEHKMHTEEFHIGEKEALVINETIKSKRRIVATGTTTTRVLEHLMSGNSGIIAGHGSTSIFIKPGYEFRCTGALLTNFHLPCSTLLMLVCAFGGYGLIMQAYEEAINRRYRFFSYGDAMLII